MMEILGQILMLAPPILITAVGACFTEITGVTNLGLEGMMLCLTGNRRPEPAEYENT